MVKDCSSFAPQTCLCLPTCSNSLLSADLVNFSAKRNFTPGCHQTMSWCSNHFWGSHATQKPFHQIAHFCIDWEISVRCLICYSSCLAFCFVSHWSCSSPSSFFWAEFWLMTRLSSTICLHRSFGLARDSFCRQMHFFGGSWGYNWVSLGDNKRFCRIAYVCQRRLAKCSSLWFRGLRISGGRGFQV